MFKTYEEIKIKILEKIAIDKREGSFAGDMASPVSLAMEAVYEAMKGILDKRFLVNEIGEDLDRRADEVGLKRKKGIKATGKIRVTGTSGTVIPKNALFGTASGLLYETLNAVTMVDTDILVDVTALEIGSKHNVPAGTVNKIPVAISGVTSCINETDITGGADTEKDESLQERIKMKLRNPSTSGNPAHYKEWASEVPGIGDAKPIPLMYGNGTVAVIPVTTDRRTPSTALRDEVKAYIESKRPIGANVTVLPATEVAINVTAALEIEQGASLADIRTAYTESFTNYVKTSVFKISNVDYLKCISLFYEIPGVTRVKEFLLNGEKSNIVILETEIQVTGTINITLEDIS